MHQYHQYHQYQRRASPISSLHEALVLVLILLADSGEPLVILLIEHIVLQASRVGRRSVGCSAVSAVSKSGCL